jgi:hypothetical protein
LSWPAVDEHVNGGDIRSYPRRFKLRAAGARSYHATADIAAARKAHDERIASDLAQHTVDLAKRTRAVETREAAAAQTQKEADDLLPELKVERADLKRRVGLLKAAAGE